MNINIYTIKIMKDEGRNAIDKWRFIESDSAGCDQLALFNMSALETP